MPRSTLDLIEELYARSAELWTCALVIGYEDHSEFVFATQARAETLEATNSHIVQGGEPIGFVGMLHPTPGVPGEGFESRILVQVVEELAEEEWAEKLLLSLAHHMGASLAQKPET